jgi:hypothetical protein
MIRLKFAFGPYEVMVEGQREHEIFQQASLWGEIATHCVGRKNIALKHRVSQGFDYYEVEDMETGERLRFGQRKEDNGLFPKGWEPPYVPPPEARQLPPPPQPSARAAAQQRGPAPAQAQRPASTQARPQPRPAPAPSRGRPVEPEASEYIPEEGEADSNVPF